MSLKKSIVVLSAILISLTTFASLAENARPQRPPQEKTVELPKQRGLTASPLKQGEGKKDRWFSKKDLKTASGQRVEKNLSRLNRPESTTIRLQLIAKTFGYEPSAIHSLKTTFTIKEVVEKDGDLEVFVEVLPGITVGKRPASLVMSGLIETWRITSRDGAENWECVKCDISRSALAID